MGQGIPEEAPPYPLLAVEGCPKSKLLPAPAFLTSESLNCLPVSGLIHAFESAHGFHVSELIHASDPNGTALSISKPSSYFQLKVESSESSESVVP